MKIYRLIIFVIAVVALCQCNKDITLSNLDIVLDNAQAAVYFHSIFVQAENVWAVVDDNDYQSFETVETEARSHRKITYSKDTNIATVEYNLWTSNNLNLNGSMVVEVDTFSYRISGKTTIFELHGFSIEGHNVACRGSILYKSVGEGENDQYTLHLFDGTAIREKNNKSSLLTSTVNGANYERIAGGETLPIGDDVWKYWGNMTGMLRDNPEMRYTNTVAATVTIYDETYHNAEIYYEAGCTTARQGISVVKIQGHDDIVYEYLCGEISFFYLTHKIRD